MLYSDCGLTSLNKGVVNQYDWNDFSNKKDPIFHCKVILNQRTTKILETL